MAVLAEKTLGKIKLQYCDDLIPSHSADLGTMAICTTEWDSNMFMNLDGATSWGTVGQADRNEYGEMYFANDTTTFSGSNTVIDLFYSSTNITHTTGATNGFNQDENGKLFLEPGRFGVYKITSYHTFENRDTNDGWSIECGPTIDNFAPTLYGSLGLDYYNSTLGNIVASRFAIMDGDYGDYANWGFRWIGATATTGFYVKHGKVIVEKVGKPLALINEKWENGGSSRWQFNNDTTNEWVVGLTGSAHEGNYSLYISDDSGANHSHTAGTQHSHAYIDIFIPEQIQRISILWAYLQNAGDHPAESIYIRFGPADLVGVTAGTDYWNSTYDVGGTATYVDTGATSTSYWNLTATQWTAGATNRLAISWRNDNIFAQDPPALLESVKLLAIQNNYTPPPPYVPEDAFVWSPFEDTLANEGWTVVNDSNNYWVVGTGAGVPTGSTTGTQAAYITNDGTTYAYTSQNELSHIYRDITFPAGVTGIEISFWWKGDGENGGGTLSYDFMAIYLNTPANIGTPLTGAVNELSFSDRIGADSNDGKFNDAYNSGTGTTWDFETITGLDSWAGQTVRLVISWIDDGSVSGSGGPCAIDDFKVTYFGYTN